MKEHALSVLEKKYLHPQVHCSISHNKPRHGTNLPVRQLMDG